MKLFEYRVVMSSKIDGKLRDKRAAKKEKNKRWDDEDNFVGCWDLARTIMPCQPNSVFINRLTCYGITFAKEKRNGRNSKSNQPNSRVNEHQFNILIISLVMELDYWDLPQTRIRWIEWRWLDDVWWEIEYLSTCEIAIYKIIRYSNLKIYESEIFSGWSSSEVRIGNIVDRKR